MLLKSDGLGKYFSRVITQFLLWSKVTRIHLELTVKLDSVISIVYILQI